ncbi:hypothetical protein NUITMVS1_12230 [Shewanella xiamenensis]|nr:hypothetical protein NUITMVS1_12230 [Shewanella xiamenensis]
MGRQKARLLAIEEAFKRMGYICEIHGGPIEYDERLIYFMTKRCAYCNYLLSKDD